ncbi:unnamed protein product [Ostreobium quekettii]|uniref:Uncharacterized protein n=1 Tax=Ostreobium quekettii TaxID=121088 RepID=A0A8S1J4I9_9CHLO|nr:unnamed protein product [Ostreobium quekettii]
MGLSSCRRSMWAGVFLVLVLAADFQRGAHGAAEVDDGYETISDASTRSLLSFSSSEGREEELDVDADIGVKPELGAVRRIHGLSYHPPPHPPPPGDDDDDNPTVAVVSVSKCRQ